MSLFDLLSDDIIYLLTNEYFSTGPLFQLILLQFVCKKLNRAMFETRCQKRLKDLRNTAPAHRKRVFTEIGAEACRYGSAARWLYDRLHFQPDVEWCYEAARGKNTYDITFIVF